MIQTPAPVSGRPAAEPATAAPSAGAATTSPEDLWNQVVGQLGTPLTRLRRIGDGHHTMTVALNPEHLGPVRVTAELREGHLHLSVQAHSEAAKALLQQGVPELRTELPNTFASLTVDVDVNTGEGEQHFGHALGDEPAGSPSVTDRSSVAEPAEEAIPSQNGTKTDRSGVDGHHVDVWS